jgi:hypothetical protein
MRSTSMKKACWRNCGASDKSDRKAAGNSATLPETGGAVSRPQTSRLKQMDEWLAGDDTAINWSSRKLAALRDHVLSIVAGFALAPKVPEVAAALLLARAIEQDEHGLDRLLSIMKAGNRLLRFRCQSAISKGISVICSKMVL